MDIYAINNIGELIKDNTYVGRGIVIGKSSDGKKAVSAYFIMGRSANSRNRIFVERDNALFTEPYDASKVEDPSLIIYAAVRRLKNKLIVTNGDQTDTIYELMDKQMTFEQSLRTREFEDDKPNYTPRISGIIHLENGAMNYAMSILKSADGDGSSCRRYTYAYSNPMAGKGSFIHTYAGDEIEQDGVRRLPSFEGEPKNIIIPDMDIDKLTDYLWSNLNKDNKVSLFVRYIDLETGKYDSRIVNKNV